MLAAKYNCKYYIYGKSSMTMNYMILFTNERKSEKHQWIVIIEKSLDEFRKK